MNAIYNRLSILWDRFNPSDGWLWFLNYSGGKDSSLLLSVVVDFLSDRGCLDGLLVVHEDTSVELPQVRASVEESLKWVESKGARTIILRAEENFFTLMLQRGYSFPRWNFRWCCRVYKYGRAKRFMGELPYKKILNLLAIRGDEIVRIHGEEVREEMICGKKVVTVSPLIDLSVADVWNVLKSQYPDLYERLKRIYVSKMDGLGCWVCTVVREDLVTLTLDPHLYELKVKLCKARCTSLRCFMEVLEEAVKERPDAFPRFKWPEEPRDVSCRGKCSNCQIRIMWQVKKVPK